MDIGFHGRARQEVRRELALPLLDSLEPRHPGNQINNIFISNRIASLCLNYQSLGLDDFATEINLA